MLDGLALLPINDLADGMKYVRQQQPQDVPELADLVNYFDATYVSGVLRPHQPNFVCRVVSGISFLVLSFIKTG